MSQHETKDELGLSNAFRTSVLAEESTQMVFKSLPRLRLCRLKYSLHFLFELFNLVYIVPIMRPVLCIQIENLKTHLIFINLSITSRDYSLQVWAAHFQSLATQKSHHTVCELIHQSPIKLSFKYFLSASVHSFTERLKSHYPTLFHQMQSILTPSTLFLRTTWAFILLNNIFYTTFGHSPFFRPVHSLRYTRRMSSRHYRVCNFYL